MRKCYDGLYEAHMKGIETVRPGAKASEVHEAINISLEKSGYKESIYANGHGIGSGWWSFLPSQAVMSSLKTSN